MASAAASAVAWRFSCGPRERRWPGAGGRPGRHSRRHLPRRARYRRRALPDHSGTVFGILFTRPSGGMTLPWATGLAAAARGPAAGAGDRGPAVPGRPRPSVARQQLDADVSKRRPRGVDLVATSSSPAVRSPLASARSPRTTRASHGASVRARAGTRRRAGDAPAAGGPAVPQPRSARRRPARTRGRDARDCGPTSPALRPAPGRRREGGVGDNAHEGELGQRARRPPRASRPRGEPVVGGVEVLVGRPEQRDEHVHVEEGRPQGTSSRRSPIAAAVTSALPFGSRTTVRPLALRRRHRKLSPPPDELRQTASPTGSPVFRRASFRTELQRISTKV